MMNDVRVYVGVTMREADDKGRVRLAFSPSRASPFFLCVRGESSTSPLDTAIARTDC